MSKKTYFSFSSPLMVIKGKNCQVIWYVLFRSSEVYNIMQSTSSQSAGSPARKLGDVWVGRENGLIYSKQQTVFVN